jgi:hypothetical protein
MGGSSSKSSVQQTNEFFNKTTNSFVSENSQKVQASALNTNTLLFPRAQFRGCRVAIRQSIDSDVVATGQMNTQNIQDLTAKLKADAASAIDNSAATKSGFLSPAIANSSTATTNLKTTVTNIIENTMTSKNVQDIFASVANKNFGDYSDLYYECDPQFKTPGMCNASDSTGCDFVVDQNIKSKIVAKGVADALTKALASTITESTVTADVKSTAATTNAGLDDLVTSVFKGLTGIWGIIAAIMVVLIIGAVIFLLSPAGQKASTTLANAGASKIKGPLG